MKAQAETLSCCESLLSRYSGGMARARNWREVRADALKDGRITEEGVAEAKAAGRLDEDGPEPDPDWLKAKGVLADVWDGEPAEVTIRRQRDEGWD